MITVERHLAAVREAGIDPDAVEKSLKACKCGMPQVVADITIVEGRVITLARCAQTDRKVCRLSKRLRIYKGGAPGTATIATSAASAVPEAEETAAPNPDQEAEQAAAEKMAEAMVTAMEGGATAEEAAGVAKATLAETAEAAEEDDEDSEGW